jgi:hypothetical protein
MDRYGRTAETRLSEDILVASKFLLSVAMRGGLPAIFVSCNEDSDLIKLIADLRASNSVFSRIRPRHLRPRILPHKIPDHRQCPIEMSAPDMSPSQKRNDSVIIS